MKFEISSIISILTFLAGAGSAVIGMVRWYGESAKKRYAAERDFNHLRNNQEQMKQSIALLIAEVEATRDEVNGLDSDFKTQTACFALLLGESGRTISGIFGHKPKPEQND